MSTKIKLAKLFRNIICLLLCVMSLFPFYIMIINATRASADIQSGISFLPDKLLFSNLAKLVDKSSGLGSPIWKTMINSLIIACPATFLAVYFSSMTAYGIHVYKFRLNHFAWSFILAVMMVPSQVSIIGFVKMMMKLNLDNTFWPLILPSIAAPSTVFFMRQYMRASLPLEIIDAARIDGSKEFHTFNTIIMPLIKPAVATQAIFAFIASWNNLFTPYMIISTSDKYTLPMFVQLLRSEQFRADYGMIYVGLLMTILPILIVYCCLSKYIIAGVALGGVKE